jgi:hypothetical protein
VNQVPSIRLSVQLEDGREIFHDLSEMMRCIVGKDPNCDIVVESAGVSRKHCRLERTSGGWQLTDLMSRNGTIVNGERITSTHSNKLGKVNLDVGDLILVGTAKIYLMSTTPVAPTSIIAGAAKKIHDLLAQNDLDTKNDGLILEEDDEDLVTLPDHLLGQMIAGSTDRDGNTNRESSNPSDLTIDFSSELGELVYNHEIPFPDTEIPQNQTVNLDGLSIVPNPKRTNSFPFEWRGYRFLSRIGSGASGRVYLAEAVNKPSEPVAIKVIQVTQKQNVSDRRRLLREIEITKLLSHHSLVEFREYGDHCGSIYIVMEYCNAGNLTQLFARNDRLNPRRTIRLLDRLLAGLAFAHKRGIVHRDLKPSNIILHKLTDGTFIPKIGDFGLAKNFMTAGLTSMTVDGSVGGTWAYMSREQLLNFRFASPQCDVWSLGAMTFEALTKQLPRPIPKDQSPIDVILNTPIGPIESVFPGVPDPLASFVNQALSDDLNIRFRDAGQMRKELAEVAKTLEVPL